MLFRSWHIFLNTVGKRVDLDMPEEEWERVTEAINSELNNVTVRDFVFTGSIANGCPNSDFDRVPKVGRSVDAYRLGNMSLINCNWTDMTAPSGVIFVGNEKEPNQSQLLVEDCLFSDITYNYPFLAAYNQNLHISRTTFKNISIEPWANEGSCGRLPVPIWDGPCAYLMACERNAICDIKHSSLENVEFSEPGDWLYKSKNATIQIDEESQLGGFALPQS